MATGLRKNASGLTKYVVRQNPTTLRMTNIKAFFLEIVPAGISLDCVRGLSESMSVSAHLLNPMAALLAKIIQSTTKPKIFRDRKPVTCTPIKNPNKAKGSANMVWGNLTKLR